MELLTAYFQPIAANVAALIWTGHLIAGLVGVFEGTLNHERWAARSWVVWVILFVLAPTAAWTALAIWAAVAVLLAVVQLFR